jgi:hypothetical protein
VIARDSAFGASAPAQRGRGGGQLPRAVGCVPAAVVGIVWAVLSGGRLL